MEVNAKVKPLLNFNAVRLRANNGKSNQTTGKGNFVENTLKS